MSLASNPAQRSGAFGSGLGVLGGRLFGPQFGIVAIGVDAGASAMLRSLGTEAKRTSMEMNKAGAAFHAVGQAVRSSVAMFSIAAVSVSGAAFAVSSFRDNIALTAAILNKDVNQVFNDLGKQAVELSKNIHFSAAEIVDAQRMLGQAGFNTSEIQAAIKPVLELAAATGGSLSQSVDLTTKVLNGFKLEASDTQRVLDSMLFLVNTTPATITDLQNAFKQFTPIAAQVGISLESSAAAIAAVTRAGLAGSTGGTSLASGLIQLLSPAEKVRQEYGDLIGVFNATLQSTGDLAMAMDAFLKGRETDISKMSRSIEELRELVGEEGFAGMTDGKLNDLGKQFEIVGILIDILGSRSAKAFLDFTVNAEQALADTVALKLGLADTAEAAEKTLSSVSAQMSRLTNQFMAPLLEGEFAEKLIRSLEAFGDSNAAEKLGQAFADFNVEVMDDMLFILNDMVNVMVNLAPVMGQLANVIGMLSSVFGTALTALSGFNSQFTSMVAGMFLFHKALAPTAEGMFQFLGVLRPSTVQLELMQFEMAKLNEQEFRNNVLKTENIHLQRNMIAARATHINQLLEENIANMAVARAEVHKTATKTAARAAAEANFQAVAAENVALHNQIIALKKLEKDIAAVNAQKRKQQLAAFASTAAFFAGFEALRAYREGNEQLAFSLGAVTTLMVGYTAWTNRAAISSAFLAVKSKVLALANTILAGSLKTTAFWAAIAQAALLGIGAGVVIAGIAAVAASFKGMGDEISTVSRKAKSAKTLLEGFGEKTSEQTGGLSEQAGFRFLDTDENADGTRRTDIFEMDIAVRRPDMAEINKTMMEANEALAPKDRISSELFSSEALASAAGRLNFIQTLLDSEAFSDQDAIKMAGVLFGESYAEGIVKAFREGSIEVSQEAEDMVLTDETKANILKELTDATKFKLPFVGVKNRNLSDADLAFINELRTASEVGDAEGFMKQLDSVERRAREKLKRGEGQHNKAFLVDLLKNIEDIRALNLDEEAAGGKLQLAIDTLVDKAQKFAAELERVSEGTDAMHSVLSSLKAATMQTINGVDVATSAFGEMTSAGFNVSKALSLFEKVTLKQRMLNTTEGIINTLTKFGANAEGFEALRASLVTNLETLGTQFAEIFNAETFDPNKIIEIWAKAMDSPRFEQNNNVVIRISGGADMDADSAARLADQVIEELNNRAREKAAN